MTAARRLVAGAFELVEPAGIGMGQTGMIGIPWNMLGMKGSI